MEKAHAVRFESVNIPGKQSAIKRTWKEYKKSRYLLLMLLPVLVWYAIFCYGPMYGILIAFKDYSPVLGTWDSPWNKFAYFDYLFNQSPEFPRILKNTIIISGLNIVCGFPAPIILALLLNELRISWFKKIAQSISYLPHFFSWVVLSGIVFLMLSPSTGPVNYILGWFGIDPIYFLGDTRYFRFSLVITNIWKEVGWGTIVYLAALSGIDQTLYEAARMDGANRWKQTWHVTLPSMLPIISIMFILSLGGILNAGFDQIYNLYSPAVFEVGDVIDTYVYRQGIVNFQMGLTTAVGLFKNIVGITLVLGTNYIVKKMGQEGVL
ncbi:ABC transporter permease [Paenibacillus sp. JDR-2]|uniref:ABC transporter permease n=1 Tax=Paenibacillus sp. (strain JDR-2) TaxID=324057 RepID=UPI0001663FEE|nr:ABC transporter permease subunit [Paenibacillus sp. JDR-2]ACT02761.1 binding-protein-dependent transport systems inner membrane component [Paenibacillus sp. JDR-2]